MTAIKRNFEVRALSRNLRQRLDHIVDRRFDQRLVVTLAHDADDRLGAAGAHQQTAALPEFLLGAGRARTLIVDSSQGSLTENHDYCPAILAFGLEGNTVMTASNDKSANKRHAAASFGRVVDDVQRVSENIAEVAASGRDDVSADLRRLSADVARLRDTVADIAKSMATEVGDAASSIGEDATSAARDQAKTLLSEAEAVARRNPLGVVIGAFGIGILIGLMKGRS